MVEIAENVKKPPSLVLVGVRGNVRENYQEHEAMGESPFGESPVKDEMIQEVMRDIGADGFVECCPQINYSVQEAMARAMSIGLEMKQKKFEGRKWPAPIIEQVKLAAKAREKKNDEAGEHGARKSSKCNVA